jgi:small conductance mechanosensitive channel
MDVQGLGSTISSYISIYGIKVRGSIVIFIIGKLVAGFLSNLVKRLMTKANTDPNLTSFVVSLTRIAMMIFVVLAALNNLGINTTSFIAILGAAGLAVGLALQGSLANFGAGVLLIIFKPFKSGDFIDAGGAAGTVQEINIFNTVLNTPDNKLVIVPNSGIIGGNITNVSAKDTRRVDLVVGVSYNDDLKKVKQVLQEILLNEDRVLKEPAPKVAVSELADSSVNLVVRPWVKASDYWGVYFDLTEKVKIEFDEQGITIPYPQRDVHVSKLVEV